MLYIAVGILGATVMPHNLYLHSSIVQTRAFERSDQGKAMAIRFATIDSTAALLFAFFINAAILIVSAAVFHGSGFESANGHPPGIRDAYELLTPVLNDHWSPACCSPWRCWRPDRTRRSPAPWPARS